MIIIKIFFFNTLKKKYKDLSVFLHLILII